MKKLLAILFLFSINVYAEVPNVYSKEQDLTAESLNENFAAMQGDMSVQDFNNFNNKLEIDINTGNISTNSSAINANEAAIGIKNGDISANRSAIGDNTSALNSNTTGISFNAGDISELQRVVETNMAAMNANSGMLKMYHANGEVCGSIINDITTGPVYKIITPEKYVIWLRYDGTTGDYYNSYPDDLRFESDDCSGPAYVINKGGKPLTNHTGFLFKNTKILYPESLDEPWLYRPVQTPVRITTYSQKERISGNCLQTILADYTHWAVYPNDPAVTGFAGIRGPITIGF